MDQTHVFGHRVGTLGMGRGEFARGVAMEQWSRGKMWVCVWT